MQPIVACQKVRCGIKWLAEYFMHRDAACAKTHDFAWKPESKQLGACGLELVHAPLGYVRVDVEGAKVVSDLRFLLSISELSHRSQNWLRPTAFLSLPLSLVAVSSTTLFSVQLQPPRCLPAYLPRRSFQIVHLEPLVPTVHLRGITFCWLML